MRRILILVSVVGLAATACGDNSVECGEGTHEELGRCLPDSNLNCGEGTFEFAGQCVAYDPNDTTAPTTTADPAGGTVREAPASVTLTSNEPALIFYTTDGSEPTRDSASVGPSPVAVSGIADGTELKFFGVDAAGNEEPVQTETYTVDTATPNPVTNFSAVDNGTDVTLSWTNPTDSDIAGVLIIRSLATTGSFEPDADSVYAAGDPVAPGEEVVFMGTGTTATDSDASPGFNAYRAWAVDGAGNLSTEALAFITREHGTQTGTISIALSNPPVVTITAQPANITLSGSAVYDSVNNSVGLALTIENGIARTLHNPKLVITSVTGGTASAPTGQYQGSPYLTLGPRSLGALDQITKNVSIASVTGAVDPVVIEVEIADDPALFVATHLTVGVPAVVVDTGTNLQTTRLACDSYSFPLNTRNRCSWRDAVTSWDGRYLYVGNRGNPVVRVVDTTRMETVAGVQLETFGNIESLSWGGQHLYAVVNTTGHSFEAFGDRQSDGGVLLIKLRVRGPELEEVGRLALVTGALAADGVRGRFMDATADGAIGAVPLWNKGEVALVDLAQMDFIDTDTNVAGVQHLDVSGVGITPREVVFSPDGATLYIGYSLLDGTSTISTVTMSDFTLGTLATTGTLGNGVNNMRFDSTGRLWVARGRASIGTAGAISVYDLAAPSDTHLHVVPVPVVNNVRYADGLALSRDGTRAYVPSFGDHNGTNTTVTPRVAIFDLSDLSQVDSDGDAVNGTTNIPVNAPPGGHTAIVTDY